MNFYFFPLLLLIPTTPPPPTRQWYSLTGKIESSQRFRSAWLGCGDALTSALIGKLRERAESLARSQQKRALRLSLHPATIVLSVCCYLISFWRRNPRLTFFGFQFMLKHNIYVSLFWFQTIFKPWKKWGNVKTITYKNKINTSNRCQISI